MKSLTCKNCGGVMVLDPSAMTARCRYCGTSYVLNHEDTDYYRDFYRQMNRFLAGSGDDVTRRRNADALWENADLRVFPCSDGRQVEIRYLYSAAGPVADTYVSRRNVIYHIHTPGSPAAETYRRMTSLLDYPSADVRSLSDFFPRVTGGFTLADGSSLLVIAKDEDEYPLRLFGKLSARHVAWIISRLENLCCVLQFSGLVHPEITPDTVFINPYTHQASLYGGWWSAARQNSYTPDRSRIARTSENLIGLRRTAAEVLGFSSLEDVRPAASVPRPMTDFLTAVPKDTAYEDFGFWDETLTRAFGERKFVAMDTDDTEIYGRKG